MTYGPGEEPKKKQTSMTWPTAYTTACGLYTSRDTMNNRPIGVTILAVLANSDNGVGHINEVKLRRAR